MIITATTPVSLGDRIARYLSKCEPAVAGQGGHDQTFFVACQLVNGFGLDDAAALEWLRRYSENCQPPWSDKELAHKVQSASKASHNKPRGHLLGERDFSRADFIAPPPRPISTPAAHADPCTEVENFLGGFRVSEAEALESSPIKPSDNWHDDAASLIFHLYQPGEQVNIVTKFSHSGDKANPAGFGTTAERDALREDLRVAEDALWRKGYRKTCDIPACNCGSQWSHGGNAAQRLSEIADALRGAGFNGGTLLSNIDELIAARTGSKP